MKKVIFIAVSIGGFACSSGTEDKPIKEKEASKKEVLFTGNNFDWLIGDW